MNRLLAFALLTILFASQATAEILVATVGPMKGQYALLGEQLRRGAEMAVTDINAAGGVNGEQLALIVEDCRSLLFRCVFGSSQDLRNRGHRHDKPRIHQSKID
jgi:Periplasmic binding protein